MIESSLEKDWKKTTAMIYTERLDFGNISMREKLNKL